MFISLLSLPFSNKFTHLPSQAFDHQVHRPKVSLGQHTNAHHYLCHQLSHHNSVQHSDTAVSLMQCDYNISKLALTLPLNYLFLDEQERFLQRTAYRRGSPTTRSTRLKCSSLYDDIHAWLIITLNAKLIPPLKCALSTLPNTWIWGLCLFAFDGP